MAIMQRRPSMFDLREKGKPKSKTQRIITEQAPRAKFASYEERSKRYGFRRKVTGEEPTPTEETPREIVTKVTIGATPAELAEVQATAGRGCPDRIDTFKTKLKDGSYILVEARSPGGDSIIGADYAEKKAKDAGYKVAHTTKKFKDEVVKQPKSVTERITVKVYNVKTNKGVKKFEVVYDPEHPEYSVDQAKRKAEAVGLTVEKVESAGEIKLSPKQAQERIKTARARGKVDLAEAQITYRAILPKDQRPPENAMPIRIDNDINYITTEAANQLKEIPAYKAAKGSPAQKLGTAYTAMQKEHTDWLNQLKTDHPALYKAYEAEGYQGLSEAIEAQNKEYKQLLAKLEPYKDGDSYRLYDAVINGAITKTQARKLFGAQAFADLSCDLKTFNRLEKKFTALPEKMILAGAPGREAQNWYIVEALDTDYKNVPYKKLTREQQLKVLETYSHTNPEYWKKQAVEVGKVALAFVPIAGTIAYWDKMSPTQRGLSIALDVVCIIPLVAGAAAGARAARGYTAGARITGALKGAGKTALAEVTAPLDMIAHPIETAKGLGRQALSAVETLVHPHKIPLGAAELAYTTTRLPVEDVGDAARAMKLRDMVVDAAIHGKRAVATIDDVTLSLNPSELQKIGGAMAVHAAPDIRPYLNGAVIGTSKGGDLWMSPNLHSRFAMATSIGDIPEGGIKGGLIIRDEKVLKALVPSGKTYAGGVELEARLPKGTTLPPPSQILITRDIAGNKLTMLVVGEPFTQAQIAKLKVLGSLDTVGQIFKPTMTLTGAERTSIGAMDDLIELSRQRAAMAREMQAAQSAGRATVAQDLSRRIADIDKRAAALVERANVPREPLRANDIVWAEYTDEGLLERWRGLNPTAAKKDASGVRLPEVDTRQSIRRAVIAREISRVPLAERRIAGRERITPAQARRVPAEGRHIVPERRLYRLLPRYTPTYAPVYAPPYTPTKELTRVPLRVPLRRVPSKGPPKMIVQRVPTKLGRERIPKPSQALQVWDQGLFWITVVEPFRTTGTKPDVIYSRQKPPWAGRIAKGRRSPQKTFRGVGRRHPKLVNLPMGVVTARVKHGKVLTFKPS